MPGHCCIGKYIIVRRSVKKLGPWHSHEYMLALLPVGWGKRWHKPLLVAPTVASIGAKLPAVDTVGMALSFQVFYYEMREIIVSFLLQSPGFRQKILIFWKGIWNKGLRVRQRPDGGHV